MTIKYKSVKEFKEMISQKEISNQEIIQEVFNLIDDNKGLNAFITLNKESSIKKAKYFDNNPSELSLAGIPIAQKDLFCTKGLRTTCGSNILNNFVPPYSATVIENLENAGCISVGKTNMDEFAMGSSNETSFFGNVHNPWGENLVPGGSSGGAAAAVAAGIVRAASGTDTGGSIRQPASFCGLVGFKPTYGTVSRYGLVAFASSLDQIGPISKSVDDARIIYSSISGHDSLDSTSINDEQIDLPFDKNATIGIVKELMEDGISEESKKEVDKVIDILKQKGYNIKEVSLPLIKLSISIYYLIAPAECSANLARFDGVRYGLRVDGKTSYEMMENTRAEGFGDEVKRRILLGTYALSAGYYDEYYGKALRARKKMVDEFSSIFKECDYLISPTTPTEAFKAGEKTSNPLEMYMSDLCTIPANLAGLPAISIPTGLSSNNLPLGVQIMSKPLTDNSLLNFSEMLEKELDFNRTPEDWSK